MQDGIHQVKIGDTIESAAWLTGEETPEDLADYRDRVREAMDELCSMKGFVRGDARFSELPIGDERVPEVPDHIQGPDVRLLVGEAELIAVAPQINRRAFVGDLEPRDLSRLRQITREAWAKSNPGHVLSDVEVDDIIEETGPEAALDALRKSVQGHPHVH